MDSTHESDRVATNRRLTRRDLLRGSGIALTGAATSLLFGCGGGDTADDMDDRPPEVTKLILPKSPAACAAPMLLAHDFLLEEGFTEVHYYPTELKYSLITEYVLDGTLDMSFNFTPSLAFNVDKNDPIVMLAGAHVACFEIFGAPSVLTTSDLKGRRVGLLEHEPQPADFAFITSILQYIGLTVGRDVTVVPIPRGAATGAIFSTGRWDAVMALAPQAFTYHDTKQGTVVLNSSTDRPWSEYVCCQIFTSQRFMEKNPVATKRALRAILRGVDVCAREPERAARVLVDKGWIVTDQYALRAMQQIPYDAWRSHSAEDALRFYSLRLADAGLIKSTPDEIIKRGTDFRYLNELKKELAFLPAPVPKRASLFNCDIDAGTEGPLALNPLALNPLALNPSAPGGPRRL